MNRLRVAVVLAVVAALFATARAFVSSEVRATDSGDVVRTVERAPVAGTAPRTELAEPAVRAPDGGAGGRVAEVLPEVPVPTAGPTLATKEEPVTTGGRVIVLQGRVVVVEPDGSETQDASGEVSLLLRGRQRAADPAQGIASTRVPLELGFFTATLFQEPDGSIGAEAGVESAGTFGRVSGDLGTVSVQVTLSEVDGGTVAPFYSKESSWVGRKLNEFDLFDREVVFRVRRVPEVVVHVVDGATGVALDDVRLEGITNASFFILGHPGNATRRLRERAARSPIRFVPERRWGGDRCYVTSPGYAWRHVSLDLEQGGERTVALEPGGDLRVKLDGEGSGSLWVRLYRGSDAPFAESTANHGGTARFDGLPCGEYVVQVEHGTRPTPDDDANRARTTILRGQTQTVELTVQPLPEPRRGRIAGSLVIPEASAPDGLRMDLVRISAKHGRPTELIDVRRRRPKPVEGGEGLYTFDLGRHPIGRYQVRVRSLALQETFDLTAAGRTDLRLALPEPIEVFVVLEDARDGSVADVDWLRWTPTETGAQRSAGSAGVRRYEGEKYFRVLLPPREVEIRAGDQRFLPATRIVTPVAGETIRIRLLPAANAVLRMTCDGTNVPWPRELAEATGLGHAGKGTSFSSGRGGLRIQADASGPYRVELPSVAGYEIPETIEVVLVIGERIEVEIPISQSSR
ncbi:MAG: hypothetical protein AAGB93_00765 [Planctomycetota bacterium]